MRRFSNLAVLILFAFLMVSCGGGGGSGFADDDSGSDSGSGGDEQEQTSAVVGSLSVTAGATALTADGTSSAVVRATVLDTGSDPVSGVTVTFTTTAGDFNGGDGTTVTRTATTNGSGIAQVTLTSSTNTGTAMVTASGGGFVNSTTVAFEAGAPDEIILYVTPTTVSPQGSITISAAVNDAHDNRISGARLSFLLYAAGAPGTIFNSLEDVTGDDGVLNTSLNILNHTGDLVLEARVVNSSVSSTANITSTTSAIVVGDLVLDTGAASAVADGTTTTLIRATVTDSFAAPVVGVPVSFSTSAGTLVDGNGVAATTANTDVAGIARLYLRSPTTTALATVTASFSGVNRSTTVTFVPGTPDPANSAISASPNTLPADGTSTTTVTVLLADENGNLVTDGTSVRLQTSRGTITSANPTTTASGRATFTVKASNTAGTATLSLPDYPGISGTVTFGSTTTGEAANISLTVEDTQVYVAGVGQKANTSITVSVEDGAGDPIADANAGVNNLRVSFVTHPKGGEYLSGTNASGTVVTTSGSTPIAIRTNEGSAAFNLQTGTLPGVVEIRVEVLDDTGASFSPALTAIVPQISIASGPPHTIVLTSPLTNSVEDLGGGVYRRVGKAIVEDRYGNAVPDGTAINLGLVDSVIVEGTDGQIVNPPNTAADNQLYSAASQLTDGTPTDFTTASIERNGVQRFIQSNDRVLLTTGEALNKNRFVDSPLSVTANLLDVHADYVGQATGLEYVVGAALLGGYIEGVDAQASEAAGSEVTKPGLATTKDGEAKLYVRYPSNSTKILTGCALAVTDDRNPPNDSGRVYVIASSSDDSATTIEEGRFCFAAIAPAVLANNPSTLSGSGPVTLWVRDSGDTVFLPGQTVSSSVEITSLGNYCTVPAYDNKDDCEANGGTWNRSNFSVTAPSCVTNTGVSGTVGYCTSNVTVTGPYASGDSATITYWSGDSNTVTVTVTIP